GLAPNAVRTALWELARRGLVTNDQYDVVRRHDSDPTVPSTAAGRPVRPGLRALTRAPRSPLRAPRSPDGRWALLGWGQPESEPHALFMASLLLQRYGVVARELALLDPAMPAWRVLYEVLSRMEMTGTVRRGYFVEGLSGAQFALPEAIPILQDCGMPSSAA